jgi:SAM-dependent methyltransferase
MDWVEAFYTTQFTWLADYYFGPVQDQHRQQAEAVARLAQPPPGRVLELGAGGGQTAAAMADLGYDVVAIELLPRAAAHAQQLAAQTRCGTLSVVQGSFYDVDAGGDFDIVCSFDGFGIGPDHDQRRLLSRVCGWLRPTGRALIEIFTPWYWSRAAGQTFRFGEMARRYAFDPFGSRMLDEWWHAAGRPGPAPGGDRIEARRD